MIIITIMIIMIIALAGLQTGSGQTLCCFSKRATDAIPVVIRFEYTMTISSKVTMNIEIHKFAQINNAQNTPSPPTKSLDFRGFDSSRLLILKGGNSHVRMIL